MVYTDIATKRIGALSFNQKVEWCKNLQSFRPPANFKYPQTPNRRRVSKASLNLYPSLAYSQLHDSVYCVDCFLFGGVNARLQNFRGWGNQTSVYRAHFLESEGHRNASAACVDAVHAHDLAGGRPTDGPLPDIMNSHVKFELARNTHAIESIMKAVLFCGEQNIPLRGHGDKDGNFNALLKYRLDVGDEPFQQFVDSAKGNAKYTSPTIQNEMLQVLGDYVQARLLADLQKARFFSLLADETQDISTQEQLSICVRFVKEDTNEVQELFLTFVSVKSTKAEELTEVLLSQLKNWGVDVSKIRGQAYDGASNMSGRHSGVQRRIRDLYPHAVYIHCMAHSLNLAMSDSCTIPTIRNMFNTVRSATVLIGRSAKRLEAFRRTVTGLGSVLESVGGTQGEYQVGKGGG